MSISPHVTLIPESFTIFGDIGELSRGERLLTKCKLRRWESVELSNGVDSAKYPWFVEFSEESELPEVVREANGVGYLHTYVPALDDEDQEGEVSIWIRLGPTHYASVVNSLRAGLDIASITIGVQGLAYGWDPDGSAKRWPEGAEPNGVVTSVAYRLVRTSDELDEDASADELIPRPDPTAQAAHAILTVVDDMRTMMRPLPWILLGVVALVIATLLN